MLSLQVFLSVLFFSKYQVLGNFVCPVKLAELEHYQKEIKLLQSGGKDVRKLFLCI